MLRAISIGSIFLMSEFLSKNISLSLAKTTSLIAGGRGVKKTCHMKGSHMPLAYA